MINNINWNNIILILIFVATITLLYMISLYIKKNNKTNNKTNNNNKIELFDNNNSSHLQKYNLLKTEIDTSTIKRNNLTYTLDTPAYINEIYMESDDEIPLDLEIIVKDTNRNIQQNVNMDKYKIDKTIGKNYSFKNNISLLTFDNILDVNDNFVYGDKIFLKLETKNITINKINIYGKNNVKHSTFDLKNSTDIKDIVTSSDNNIDYVITKIVVDNNDKRIFEENNQLTTQIQYSNNIENGEKTYNGPINDNFVLTAENNVIFCFNRLIAKSISLTNTDLIISEVKGYIADSNHINSYKFDKGLISFKDSLNPDSVCDFNRLKNTVTISENILDVLNYQDTINYETNELDKNKINLMELENQRLETQNLINRINNYSNKYIDDLKKNDDYNVMKYNQNVLFKDTISDLIDSRMEQNNKTIDVPLTIITDTE